MIILFLIAAAVSPDQKYPTSMVLVTIPALAALAGTIAGGLISFIATDRLKRAEWKEQRLTREIERREGLYAEFLSEVGKLLLSGIKGEINDPHQYHAMFRLTGMISLVASSPVASAADVLAKSAIAAGGRDKPKHDPDTSTAFSDICRAELEALRMSGLSK